MLTIFIFSYFIKANKHLLMLSIFGVFTSENICTIFDIIKTYPSIEMWWWCTHDALQYVLCNPSSTTFYLLNIYICLVHALILYVHFYLLSCSSLFTHICNNKLQNSVIYEQQHLIVFYYCYLTLLSSIVFFDWYF